MENIPTAKEFQWLKKKYRDDVAGEIMIEFAKLHLEAQKEAIKLKISKLLEQQGIYLTDDWDFEKTGNTVIDEAYPLTNVK